MNSAAASSRAASAVARLGAVALLLCTVPGFAQQAPAEPARPRFDAKGRPIQAKAPKPKSQPLTLPKARNRVSVRYTKEALDKNVSGAIVLRLSISKTGKVLAAKLIEGLGHGLDENAIAAALKLRFSPARRANGTPFRAAILYRFKLRIDTQEKRQAAPATGRLRGTILSESQLGATAPLAGARLELRSITLGNDATKEPTAPRVLRSNAKGSFNFSILPPGLYSLRLSAPGYMPLTVRETIAAGKESLARYRLRLNLGSKAIEVYVDGDKPPRAVTKRTLERREIERIPGTNGDALRSIQSLPGVARPPAIIGALLIRGSSPIDSQTFIDGTYVPLIYHFGGLSSVVPTELLEKIDFYPGNFSAKYGRAQGGIVDATLRSPRSDGYHGLAQVDLIDVRGLFEGPLFGSKRWSFAVAARRSYFDAWLGPVLEGAGAGVTQAPVYYDYQLLVEGRPNNAGRFRASFIGSDDALDLLVSEPRPNEPALSGNVGLSTSFQRLSLRYDHRFSAKTTLNSMVSLGRDALSFGLSQFFFNIEAFSVLSRVELQTRLSPHVTMNSGFDFFGGHYDLNLRLPAPPQPGQPPNQPFSSRTVNSNAATGLGLLPAGYIEFELQPHERWQLIPGIRLDYFNLSDNVDFSPRLTSRLKIRKDFPKTTLKGGVGVFKRAPQFQQAVPPFGTEGLKSNRSIHSSLGIEQQISRQIDLSAELFHKHNSDQIIGQPGPSGTTIQYTNEASGYAIGGEFLLKYNADKRFFGWVAYTLSRSIRRLAVDAEDSLAPWDQTHILTMLGSYRLGDGWEFGARLRLVSGNLITPNVCNASNSNCDPTRVGGLFHGATGAYTPIPAGSIQSERLPLFHQLDIRVDKSWVFSWGKFSAYLDVQNAYNNQNVEAILYNFNFSQRSYVAGIPILPSLGMRGDW